MKIDIIVSQSWHAPQLARGLVSLGCDVRIITATREADWPTGVDVYRIPLRSLLRTGRISRRLEFVGNRCFASLSTTAVRPGSIVICWSGFMPSSIDPSRCVLVRGSTHILRQWQILSELPNGKPPSKWTIERERTEYRNAHSVTVPTPEIASDPLWEIDRASVIVDPYGFDCGVDAGGSTDHTQDRRSRIVFGGELSTRKGVDRMVAALSTRPEGYTDFCVAAREPAGSRLPSWWTIVGRGSHRAWHRLLSRSGVLLLLSHEEGMARVGLEAAAEGVPIVVTPQTGLGSIVRSGGGLLTDGSAADVVRALQQVRQEWGQFHGRASNAANWTWRDHANRLLRHIGKI